LGLLLGCVEIQRQAVQIAAARNGPQYPERLMMFASHPQATNAS